MAKIINYHVLCLLLMLLTCKQMAAQVPKDSASGKYVYQGVVKVDSATKQQLYARGKTWVLKTLKSMDNMVELDDKEFNSIVGSGTIIIEKQKGGVYTYDNARLNFKAILQFKDGRLKYSFENFIYSADMIFTPGGPQSIKPVTSGLENLDLRGKGNENVLNAVDAKMKALIASFVAEVSAASKKQGDDW